MSGYIHFSEEEKQKANSVDLVEFLQRRGEKLLPSGRDKRLASDHSITIRGNQWFDHSSEEGSHAIDLVRRLYHLSFPEAVTLLLGGEQRIEYRQYAPAQGPELKKLFVLPPPNPDMRRVFAYLIKRRFIDRDVVTYFTKAKMLYEDKYHNAVFVGYDQEGIPRHAHKRSTCTGGKCYKGNAEGCDPRFSFHFTGTSNSIYVFEAPIDLLSFITLRPEHWEQHSFVSLCGVAEHALLQRLQENPHIQKVCLCLDHDDAGMKAAERLRESLKEHGYSDVSVLQSQYKDWNEDLKARHGVEAIPAEGQNHNIKMII